MPLLRDMKLMSYFVARQGVALTEVLSCRATLFECMRHNLLSLRQVQLACDVVTSLIYCFLDPYLALAIYKQACSWYIITVFVMTFGGCKLNSVELSFCFLKGSDIMIFDSLVPILLTCNKLGKQLQCGAILFV